MEKKVITVSSIRGELENAIDPKEEDRLRKKEETKAERVEDQRIKETKKKQEADMKKLEAQKAREIEEKLRKEASDKYTSTLTKLREYYSYFPDLESILGKLPAGHITQEEVDSRLATIRDYLGHKTKVANFGFYGIIICSIIEKFDEKMKHKNNLQNITDYWAKNYFEPIIAEIRTELIIEYPWLFKSNIIMKMIAAGSLIIAQTQQINQKENEKKEVNKE